VTAPPVSAPMPAPAPLPLAPTVATTLGASAAQVDSLPPPRRASKAPWIAGGVLLCGGAVAAIAIASGGSKQAADAAHTTAPVDASLVRVVVGPPPDEAPVRRMPEPEDGTAPDYLVAAQQEIAQRVADHSCSMATQ